MCGTVSASEKAGVGTCGPFKHSASLDTVVSCECVVCVALGNWVAMVYCCGRFHLSANSKSLHKCMVNEHTVLTGYN